MINHKEKLKEAAQLPRFDADAETKKKLEEICEELQLFIDSCMTLGSEFFNVESDAYSNSELKRRLMHNMPELFVHILQRYPGQFEKIVGYEYKAYPEILRAAIAAGERIALEHEYPYPHGGWGAAILEPIIRVVDAAIEYCDEVLQKPSASSQARERSYYKEFEAFKDCVALLCSVGASVNDRSRDGYTLLYGILDRVVSSDIRKAAVAFLIERGAMPDLVSDFIERAGATPLHLAFKEYGKEIDIQTLDSLLSGERPMDLFVRDYYGDTPLDLAMNNSRVDAEAIRLYMDCFDRLASQDMTTDFCIDLLGKMPMLYLLARPLKPFDFLYQVERSPRRDFEAIADILIDRGVSINAKVVEFEGGLIHSFEGGRPLVDVIVENKDGKFDERVVEYFKKKQKGHL